MPLSSGYGKRAIASNFHKLYQENRTGKRKSNPRKRDQIIAIALNQARTRAEKAGDKAAVAKLTKSILELESLHPELIITIEP